MFYGLEERAVDGISVLNAEEGVLKKKKPFRPLFRLQVRWESGRGDAVIYGTWASGLRRDFLRDRYSTRRLRKEHSVISKPMCKFTLNGSG